MPAKVKKLQRDLTSTKERATALELEKERAMRRFASTPKSAKAAVARLPVSSGKENSPAVATPEQADEAPEEQCTQS